MNPHDRLLSWLSRPRRIRTAGVTGLARCPWLVLLAVTSLVLAVFWVKAGLLGWKAVGDNAVIALRSHDVFSRGSPTLGIPSNFRAWSSEADPHHPGPAVFWALAPTIRAFGVNSVGVLTGTWLVMVAAIGTVMLVASHYFGTAGAASAALMSIALAISANSEYFQPLNPTIALVPCLAVCLLTWGIVEGDHRLWPLLVLWASFIMQAEWAYFPTAAASLSLASTASLMNARTRWKHHRSSTTRHRIVITIIVVLVMWALPIANAIGNSGGNFRQAIRAALAEVPPAGLTQSLSWASPLLWGVVILGLPALRGLRVGRPARRSLAISAGLLAVATIVGQAATPAAAGTNTQYQYPLLVVTAFGYWALIATSLDSVSDGLRPLTVKLCISGGAVLLIIQLYGGWTQPNRHPAWLAEGFGSIDPLIAQLDSKLPDGRYAVLDLGGPKVRGMLLGLAPQLAERGIDVRVEEPLARYLGANRRQDGTELGVLMVTYATGVAPTPESRLVARWTSPRRGAVDVRRFRAEQVDAVRSGDQFQFGRNQDWAGRIIAGTGMDRELISTLNDEGLNNLSKRIRAHPDMVPDLSEQAISDLIEQGAVAVPAATSTSANDSGFLQVPVVSIWLAPV